MTMKTTNDRYDFYAKQLGFTSEKEMLEQLYEGHSIPEVAEVLKVATGTVLKRLEACGIPRRNRGGLVKISQVRYKLFHVDQRVVHVYGLTQASATLGVSTSTLYKYRQWKCNRLEEMSGNIIKRRNSA